MRRGYLSLINRYRTLNF